jgi:hypothetical protein
MYIQFYLFFRHEQSGIFSKSNKSSSMKKKINPATPKVKRSLYKVCSIVVGVVHILHTTRCALMLAANLIQQSVIYLAPILLKTS